MAMILRQSAFLLRQSDILIAAANPDEPGKAGCTLETVREALAFDLLGGLLWGLLVLGGQSQMLGGLLGGQSQITASVLRGQSQITASGSVPNNRHLQF